MSLKNAAQCGVPTTRPGIAAEMAHPQRRKASVDLLNTVLRKRADELPSLRRDLNERKFPMRVFLRTLLACCLLFCLLFAPARAEMPSSPEERYAQELSLLNSYLQNGVTSEGLDIHGIYNTFAENGNIGEHTTGFRGYAEALALIEDGDFARARAVVENLQGSTSYAAFRAYLEDGEDLRSRGLYAIRPLNELEAYMLARECEALGQYAQAASYYDQCQMFFDAYDRLSYAASVTPAPTPTPSPTPEQLYISRDPDTYVKLGKEAEASAAVYAQQGQEDSAQSGYEEAGAYYLKALEFDPTDRDTAIDAANAYIRAGNAGRAAEALEYLIAIDPNDSAPYNTLKQLYPDAASRPQHVTQLLRQGAQNTGDASLAQ